MGIFGILQVYVIKSLNRILNSKLLRISEYSSASEFYTEPNRTVPHYTVCDRIFENTTVTFIVTFFVTFKHRYKKRHIKRDFLKNNSVTENIPLPLLSVTHA